MEELALLSSLSNLSPFNAGDFIVYAGDMGREMYCVRRGQVEVIGDDDFTVVGTLGPGAYFGEVCVLLAVPK